MTPAQKPNAALAVGTLRYNLLPKGRPMWLKSFFLADGRIGRIAFLSGAIRNNIAGVICAGLLIFSGIGFRSGNGV